LKQIIMSNNPPTTPRMSMLIRELLCTCSSSSGPLAARLFLAGVMFPHGAQKVLGWFGGYGMAATLKFFNETLHIPTPLALLAFAAEFLGPLDLIVGLGSRVAALGIAITMAVAVKFHLPNGFFMNWYGSQQGEGFEFHLLMIGLALVVLIQGGGRLSVDGCLARRHET
jgi:putative oxidoreductase